MNVLVFDIKGPLAHFKKYYATTSALTYALPPKTSLYGFVGAILGFPKAGNAYLRHFEQKSCLTGLLLQRPLQTARLGVNLRPHRGRYKDNPKPTLIEFVKEPCYRVYFHHQDGGLQNDLKAALQAHACVYTPSLGLANLLADFEWIGACDVEKKTSPTPVWMHSAIPRAQFQSFGQMENSDIIEQTMFAIEMDMQRNVTERDDLVFDRKGGAINAVVTHYYQTSDYGNIALF